MTSFAAFDSDALSLISMRRLDRQLNASWLINACQVLSHLNWAGSQTRPTRLANGQH